MGHAITATSAPLDKSDKFIQSAQTVKRKLNVLELSILRVLLGAIIMA